MLTQPLLGRIWVGFSLTSGHQCVSNLFWKRNVHEMVAMYVTDFSPPQTIFCPAKPVWPGFDTRPIQQSGFYSFLSP